MYVNYYLLGHINKNGVIVPSNESKSRRVLIFAFSIKKNILLYVSKLSVKDDANLSKKKRFAPFYLYDPWRSNAARAFSVFQPRIAKDLHYHVIVKYVLTNEKKKKKKENPAKASFHKLRIFLSPFVSADSS